MAGHPGRPRVPRPQPRQRRRHRADARTSSPVSATGRPTSSSGPGTSSASPAPTATGSGRCSGRWPASTRTAAPSTSAARRLRSYRSAVDHGVVYLSSDRRNESLFQRPDHRRQPRSRRPRRAVERRRHAHPPGAGVHRRHHREVPDPGRARRPVAGRAVRRQPAEGRAEPGAGDEPDGRADRRADPGRRRPLPPRHLPLPARHRRQRQRGRGRQLRRLGARRPVRPGPGHVPRQDHRRAATGSPPREESIVGAFAVEHELAADADVIGEVAEAIAEEQEGTPRPRRSWWRRHTSRRRDPPGGAGRADGRARAVRAVEERHVPDRVEHLQRAAGGPAARRGGGRAVLRADGRWHRRLRRRGDDAGRRPDVGVGPDVGHRRSAGDVAGGRRAARRHRRTGQRVPGRGDQAVTGDRHHRDAGHRVRHRLHHAARPPRA